MNCIIEKQNEYLVKGCFSLKIRKKLAARTVVEIAYYHENSINCSQELINAFICVRHYSNTSMCVYMVDNIDICVLFNSNLANCNIVRFYYKKKNVLFKNVSYKILNYLIVKPRSSTSIA